MILYRLETEDGEGAYGALPYSILARSFHPHPSPDEDGMPANGWDHRYYFGFASMGDLLKWFPITLFMPMFRHQIQLALYDVDECHVCKGRTQLAFNMDHAIRVKSKSLQEIARDYH